MLIDKYSSLLYNEYVHQTFLLKLIHYSCIFVRKTTWSVNSSMDSSRFNSSPGNSSSGPSRLVKIIKDFQIKLFARFEEIKNEFPMKLLLFLVGFYCATGFATVIGQTGDWDVLAAGLAVIVVEGIGALMYNNSFPLLRKIKNFVSMFNFWKAGVTMGLFLDAFKYKIDDIFVLPVAPINFDIDVFRMFL
uniref:Ycf20-like protein n=1 Tax=Daucus carota subsp. sativus TaxID=79200 RepID=A0A162A3U9_DAUCS